MRITKISVKGLFGMFDHEIPLNQESRITIMHGPNGVGKTVLLRMLHGLFHYDYRYLRKIPFEQFRVEFADGGFITAKKDEKDDDDGATVALLIKYVDSAGKAHNTFRHSVGKEYRRQELVKETLPHSIYIRAPFEEIHEYWIEEIEGIAHLTYTWEEILQFNPTLETKLYGELPDWFVSILNEVNSKLVSTSRLKLPIMKRRKLLSTTSEREDIDLDSSDVVVADLAASYDGLVRDLKDAKARIEKHSPKIDDLSAKLAKKDEMIAKIEAALAQNERSNTSLLEDLLTENMGERELLWQDMQEIHADSNFVESGELFLDIINERLLFKTLEFNAGEDNLGLDAESKFRADNGGTVPWSSLSSGEQHLLVLYDQLLLLTGADTLVMIDEPELSMNVVWQRNFLKDLQRIIELRNFDVLIATHSPQIIHDKWDWMVPLGETLDE